MSCKKCLYVEVCPKAEHIENYRFIGCSDFKTKEGEDYGKKEKED